MNSDRKLTYSGVVYPWHCDHMGHMNVMHYVGKFDEATWCFFAGIGLTRDFLDRNGRGMAALEQHIEYKKELLAGDIVEIRTGLIEMRNKTMRFVHEMHNAENGNLAASTELVAAYLDTELRKAAPFPEQILKCAETVPGP